MYIPEFFSKYRKLLYSSIAVVIVLSAISFHFLPDGKLHIYFLNVGQGDAIFIRTPANQNVLIDGGPYSNVLEELGKVMFFMDRQIDVMVLTHPHSDHVGGLIEILKRYKVKKVMLTGVIANSPDYLEFLKEINKQDIEIIYPISKTDYYLGNGLYFDIVYPFESLIGKDIENLNNSSIAIKIIYKNNKILVTGDDEEIVENQMLKAGLDVSADIFKAGHHGSKTANSMRFLQTVDPEKAVIQSGAGNSYGHPHFETLKKFVELGITDVKRNDTNGTIEYILF
jgi:competence protein ComEC